MTQQGFTLWLTGLSGSGKSTLTTALAGIFRERGYPVELLDGDEVRTHLSKGLTFSKEDRDINVRRIGYVARLLARNGVIVLTAAISLTPYGGRTSTSRRISRAALGPRTLAWPRDAGWGFLAAPTALM